MTHATLPGRMGRQPNIVREFSVGWTNKFIQIFYDESASDSGMVPAMRS